MEAGPSPQGPEASIVCRKKTLELIFCIYFFPNKVMFAASHMGPAGSQRRPRPAEPTLPREAAGRPRLGLAFKVHCAEWQRLPRPAQASQHGQGPPAREPSPDGASWSLQHRCTARPPGVPGPALQAPPPPQLPHCQQRVGSTPCTTLLRRSVCPSVRLSVGGALFSFHPVPASGFPAARPGGSSGRCPPCCAGSSWTSTPHRVGASHMFSE